MSTSKSSKTSSNKSDDAVSSLFKEISVTKRINEEGTVDNMDKDYIRVINYLDFRKLKSFPRYPENSDICVNLDDVDFTSSFLIFLSHRWLRGDPKSPGYDGRPHPDNAKHEKFKLTIKAIDMTWGSLVEEGMNCYVWLDYGCINQDGDPAGELRQLEKIIEYSDMLLSVVVDDDYNDWEYGNTMDGLITGYKAKPWVEYLSRAWCRVEMLYAANIPLQENRGHRIQKFKAGVRGALERNYRPHLLYGTKELKMGFFAGILCPLQTKYLELYSPADGYLTKKEDRVVIESLMDRLSPYMKIIEEGYAGDRNSYGLRCGQGKLTLKNGFVYEGEWENDLPSGKGKLVFPDGNVYVGNLKNGKITGSGTCYFTAGNVQSGDWLDGLMHGQAVVQYSGGGFYQGEVVHGIITGFGQAKIGEKYVLYEGEFKDGNGHNCLCNPVCPYYCCKFFSTVCFRYIHRESGCRPYSAQELVQDHNYFATATAIFDLFTCRLFKLSKSRGGQGAVVMPIPSIKEYVVVGSKRNIFIDDDVKKPVLKVFDSTNTASTSSVTSDDMER